MANVIVHNRREYKLVIGNSFSGAPSEQQSSAGPILPRSGPAVSAMLSTTEVRSTIVVATYLLDIVFLLTAAVIAVPVFRAIGLGVVPGFLVAGILVGPSGLALIDNSTEIRHLAELGVVLLLFVIGIELKPARLWLMRRLVFGLGTLQVVVTGALITAALYLAMDLPFRTAVVIGPALA